MEEFLMTMQMAGATLTNEQISELGTEAHASIYLTRIRMQPDTLNRLNVLQKFPQVSRSGFSVSIMSSLHLPLKTS